jgi:hypothetical protein
MIDFDEILMREMNLFEESRCQVREKQSQRIFN